MATEIVVDLEIILGIVIAFLVGLGGLYGYFKIRPYIKSRTEISDISQVERLEYYERQLIDMKIRLDALEIQGIDQKPVDPNLELKQFLEKLAKNEEISQNKQVEKISESQIVPEKIISTPTNFKIEHTNPTDHVLHLITDKAMTSRDIQITLKRTREHTSRLMKKLFEDGFVQRNTESKPYTYSITDKGKAKIGNVEINPTTA